MRNLISLCVCMLLLPLIAGRAGAAICALDDPPAATLLLPYFEVDIDHPSGVTTLFSIANASATAVLANVVLWTDLGVPTLSFPVYLTGYDVQTINLRDTFAGNLPQTASVGQDPDDSISPHQPILSQDINFASCAGLLPPPPLDAAAVADLRAAHTGLPSASLGGCAAQAIGDGHVRGYVTIDTVSSCSTTRRTPADAGYFGAGGTGRATDQNVLWGDFFLLDSSENTAEGETLVRVEAQPEAFHSGDLTFYGVFDDYTAIDDREPLATAWGMRFLNGGNFSGGTDTLAWRDPQRRVTPFPCNVPNNLPSWYPLGQRTMVIFDEQEHPVLPFVCPFECPPGLDELPFPAAANRVHVGGASFPVPFDFGWVDFDLKISTTQSAWVPGLPMRSQSWLVTLMSAAGRYGEGFSASPFDTGCAPIVDCTNGVCSPPPR